MPALSSVCSSLRLLLYCPSVHQREGPPVQVPPPPPPRPCSFLLGVRLGFCKAPRDNLNCDRCFINKDSFEFVDLLRRSSGEARKTPRADALRVQCLAHEHVSHLFGPKLGPGLRTRTIEVAIRQIALIVRLVYIRRSAAPAYNTPSSGPGSSLSRLAKPNQTGGGKAAIVAPPKTKRRRKQDLMGYCAAGSEPELFIYRRHRSPL